MFFSLAGLKQRSDGLRHQFNELSFSFRFHRWAVMGGLVVVERERDLLHASAPGVYPSSP